MSFAAFGQDVITNFMSPIVSYQRADDFASEALTNGGIESAIISYEYQEDFGSAALTNGGILSPIASYQYYEWPGDGILNLQSSPIASYYYQFLDAPLLNIVSTTRTPTTAESTPAYPTSPPSTSQLMAFHGGIFTANLASVNPNQMTIVLTHGWIPGLGPLELTQGIQGWPTDMANALVSEGINENANIVAWDWGSGATSILPGTAASHTPDQGSTLGQALLSALGANYTQPIHFVGHSLGTLVNAYAANYLHGDHWGAKDPVSPTPWPANETHMTLFDEAEAATDINNFMTAIDTLAGWNGNPLLPKPSYYHPLPIHFEWADNYISAFGLLHPDGVNDPKAANVILNYSLPADAPDVSSWLSEMESFHGYPIGWYEETIQNDGASAMGFRWSFETGGWFSQAPALGSVYVQNSTGSQWDLSVSDLADGANLLNTRYQSYRDSLAYAITGETPNSVAANGNVSGETIVGALPAFNAFILSLLTTPAPNDPSYAWVQIFVPTGAVSMSFDYRIQGDWASDSLAAALNGTNVLSIPGGEIQTNLTFSSGAIDVSAFSGQTNELFIGILGTTSTNAQLTVENLTFSIASAPSLQAQASGDSLTVSWPMSAENFMLQATTNLADPSSWGVLTNVPVIVNLQNAVTNLIPGGVGFFRLIKTQ